MASWKDTIQDETEAPTTSSWKDSIQDESKPSLMQEIGNSGWGGLAKDIGNVAKDFSIGATQGASMGAADEIGGGLAALAEKGLSYIPGTEANKSKNVDEQLQAQGFDVPEESVLDNYRTYQKGSENAFKQAGEDSPIANTLGNIGGSMMTGIAGGKLLGIGDQAKNAKSAFDVLKSQGGGSAALKALKEGKSLAEVAKILQAGGKTGAAIDLGTKGLTNYAKAAPAIAAESALTSEGNLDEGNRGKLLSDVGGSLAFGLPAILGMQGMTDLAAPAAKEAIQTASQKLDDFAQNRPFLRQLRKSMEYGEQGINPVAENQQVKLGPGEEGLIRRDTSRAQGLMDEITQADTKLGQEVGNSLAKAEARGATIDVAPSLQNTLEAMKYSFDNLADIAENTRGRQIFDKIKEGATTLSPTDAKFLLDDVDSYISRFGAMRTPGPLVEQKIIPGLQKFRANLAEQIKNEIPEYRLAAERFNQFRKLVPETILSKDIPRDVSGIYMGDLKNPELGMLKNLRDISVGATRGGSSIGPVKESYENMIQGMNKWTGSEAARNQTLLAEGKEALVNPLQRSPEDFAKTIRDYADDAAVRRQQTTVEETRALGKNAISAFTGGGEAPRAIALGAANLAGRASKPIKNLGKYVYNLPAEKLNVAADQMSQNPALKHLGMALKDGLANGDQAKKNAALFSILQNPEARLFFNSDEEE
jgi:hypothetical protein